MNEYELLLPYLQFLASALGSGVAASWLFKQARALFPNNPPKSKFLTSVLRILYLLLYSPRLARFSAPITAALVSYTATMGMNSFLGVSDSGGFEALAAALISQFVHALGKPILPSEKTIDKA